MLDIRGLSGIGKGKRAFDLPGAREAGDDLAGPRSGDGVGAVYQADAAVAIAAGVACYDVCERKVSG